MLISFSNSQRYNFAMQFVNRANAVQLGIKLGTNPLEIEVQDPVLGRLLQRISDHRAVIFPYINANSPHHSWLITASTSQEIDLLWTRISSFLVPTYATCATKNRLPLLISFKDEQHRLLYPVGYYSLRAPAQYFKIILRRIELWMDLEEERPALRNVQRTTYRPLYELFQAAISATNWQEAERHLYEMQQLHLVTADNVAFLQIQLLAQQQRWLDIWQRPDFALLARIRVPNAVRRALLTAFHASTLLTLEQQRRWKDALEAFQKNRAALGLLLTGRFGLTQFPVIQIFAYQAALDKDSDSLAQLYDVTSVEDTRECIRQLQQLLENDTQKTVQPLVEVENGTPKILTPLRQARIALSELDYDSAIRFAREVIQPTERAIILLQIAFHNSDVALGEEALLSYWELPKDEQSHLETTQTFLTPCLRYLSELTRYQATTDLTNAQSANPLHIQTWLEWFEVVEATPDHSSVVTSLDYLLANREQIVWGSGTMTQLNEKLFGFLFTENGTSIHQKRKILQHFVDYFLQEAEFPRMGDSYPDMYETLYDGIREINNVSQNSGFSILRLADALLQQAPLQCEKIYNELTKWCPTPIPALEAWVLEAFDLFAEYGISAALLTSWYRTWVSSLLDLPSSRERVDLETWRLFGNWIQPGADILRRLELSLTQVIQEEARDILAELPVGYKIGIFTLREGSAKKAKKLLLDRNSALDIRICTEKDLNEQAKSLAQNSDMVVIVTTCISHALTYGIRPYLTNDPVYPHTAGSTSILRAIDGYAKSVVKSKVANL